jgi:hypothetical protein
VTTPEQRERWRESTAAYRQRNPEKYRLANRKHSLLKRYGISIEQYNRLHRLQKGCCAVCGEPEVGDRLEVDHNHKTGKVRGLLCRYCNLAIGHLRDCEKRAERIAKYLKSV